MAKLYFRYGTMDSAKTMNLLAVAHNYRQQGKKVALLKPRIDDRFGGKVIASRSGLEKSVDLLLEDDTRLDPPFFADLDCVLVDEAQFLSVKVIEQLRALTRTQNVPVICYGLRTDFRTRLFDGARRLFELADSIEEIKVTCQYCNRKAIFNLRLIDGEPSETGEQIQLGANESYAPACHSCYVERLPGAIERAYLKS
ncbi:MAG: thymidine kinase [Enhygromyxa sp.]